MNVNECKIFIIEDADSRVDEQEIRKRVAYSRSVRLKTVSIHVHVYTAVLYLNFLSIRSFFRIFPSHNGSTCSLVL